MIGNPQNRHCSDLSSDFFSIYINDLIKILRKTGIGCHMIDIFIACILFADNMTLMAPTRDSFKQILNTSVLGPFGKKVAVEFTINQLVTVGRRF